MFDEAFPILTTRDLSRALAFYRDLLGGTVTYAFPADGDPVYVAMDIGSAHLGLGQAEDAPVGPGRISLWLYTSSCDTAVDKLRAEGVTILSEPADQPWGERTALVQDPDGNQVHIGQKP